MAYKQSTGLVNSLMGKQDSITASTIAAVAAGSIITDSGNGLFTAGFRPGDTAAITGFTGDTSNNKITTVTSIESDGSQMVVAATLVNDAAGESVTIKACAKTFKDVFRNNVIRVYSGTVPADGDATEGTGVLLLKITLASGAVVPGVATNGNDFDTIVAGLLSKDANVWSGVGLADGTAAWWRMYDNGEVTGSSSTSKRCQGSVSTTSTTFILSSTTIVTSATTTLDTANFTMPAS